MAHQIITDEESRGTKTPDGEKKPNLFDRFLTFWIISNYFFFTGLAILFRSPIPRAWLKLGQELGGKKIARKVEDISKAEISPKKKQVKVIDLETRQDISPLN